MAMIVNAGDRKQISSSAAAKNASALKNALPATYYPRSLKGALTKTTPETAPEDRIPSKALAQKLGLTPVKPQPKTPAKPKPKTPATGAKSSTGPTADQKRQGDNLLGIAKYNARSIIDQYNRAASNIELSNQQNRALAATQKKQNSASAANDRFAQLMKLQSSASSVIGSAGNALQGSQSGNLAGMLGRRNDMDSAESFNTLKSNQNSVMNALYEAVSQNVISLNEAASLAENMLRGVESDTSAQLNNINQKMYVKPGTGKVNVGAAGFAKGKQKTAATPERSGYMTQAPRSGVPQATPANTGSSYFDQLMSGYGRS